MLSLSCAAYRYEWQFFISYVFPGNDLLYIHQILNNIILKKYNVENFKLHKFSRRIDKEAARIHEPKYRPIKDAQSETETAVFEKNNKAKSRRAQSKDQHVYNWSLRNREEGE